MWSSAREIAAGDTIIVWMTREQLLPVVVTPGAELNGRFGYYRHSELVGVPFGSKVASRNGRGFIHVLRPTPELWTRALPHRTQILYIADIAFVTSWLNIRPGSTVVEAGTGSGSFSHSTARTVGPTGHLYSYEFHEARATKAKEDFARHGFANITLTHRNVCKDGFTVEDAADAVFLDLPAPWEAIEHAKKALRKDRVARICCFSPCMEQVLRTVAALNAAGFSDVTMYEALLRPHDVSAPAPPQRVADVAARLRAQEKRREEKRLVQISQARTRGAGSGAKRKAPDAAVDGAAGEPEVKKARVEPALGDVPAEADAAEPGAPVDDAEQLGTLVVSAAAASGALGLGNASLADTVTMQAAFERTPAAAAGRRWDKVAANGEKMVLSRPFSEVKGHTSYLTFACLVPGTADAASALIAASALVPGAETDALVEGAATTVQNGHDAMVVDQDSA